MFTIFRTLRHNILKKKAILFGNNQYSFTYLIRTYLKVSLHVKLMSFSIICSFPHYFQNVKCISVI